jgi:hypothetical protein
MQSSIKDDAFAGLVDLVILRTDGFSGIKAADRAADVLVVALEKSHGKIPLKCWVNRIMEARQSCIASLFDVMVAFYEGREDDAKIMTTVMDVVYERRDMFDEDFVRAFSPISGKPEMFGKLLDYKERRILDPENPFFGQFPPDEYWKGRVCSCIAAKDWVRAWDDLRKADRGLPQFGTTLAQISEGTFKCCAAASHEAVTFLVRSIYSAMREGNLVPSVGRHNVTVAISDGPIPRDKQIPGYALAGKHFLISESASHPRKLVFSPEGQMAITIASYSRTEKNAQRRKKREAIAANLLKAEA